MSLCADRVARTSCSSERNHPWHQTNQGSVRGGSGPRRARGRRWRSTRPSLRRHDPDQVRRVTAMPWSVIALGQRNLSLFRGPPRNGGNVGRWRGVTAAGAARRGAPCGRPRGNHKGCPQGCPYVDPFVAITPGPAASPRGRRCRLPRRAAGSPLPRRRRADRASARRSRSPGP
jgi:hypothetical protein